MDLLNDEDGLRSSIVLDAAKDDDGLIWLATANGLVAYDGFVFTRFSTAENSPVKLNDNWVGNVIIEEDGNLLISTKHGISRIDFKERVEKVIFEGEKTGDFLYRILPGKSYCWILSDNKIGQLRGNEIEYSNHTCSPKYIDIIESDVNGNLVLIDKAHGLRVLGNQQELIFHEPIDTFVKRIASIDPFQYLTSVLDEEGNIVLIDGYSSFFRFNESMTSLSSFSPAPNSIAGSIGALHQRLLNSKEDAVLKNNVLITLSCTFYDKQDFLWVGTNFGLIKISIVKNDFEVPAVLEGGSMRQLYEGKNGLIYGGAYPPYSFFSFNRNSKKADFYPFHHVWSIEPVGGDSLLLSSEGGGFILFDENKNEKIWPANVHTDNISYHVLEVGKDGKVWAGSGSANVFEGSLNSLDSLRPFQPKDGKTYLQYNMANCIKYDLLDDNLLWLGNTKGLFLLDIAKERFQSFISTSPIATEYLEGVVYCIVQEEDGNLWVGTLNGFFYLDREKGITRHYKTENGLCDNTVYTMAKDRDGNLWLATRNGLSRFDPITEKFLNFYEEDGLPHLEFNRSSVWAGSDGQLYFGGLNGFVYFDPDKLVKEELPFKPFISKYKWFDPQLGQEVENIRLPAGDAPIRLDPYHRDIEFWMSLTNLSAPRLSKFKFKLEGFDKDWIYREGINSVRYTNLDAGAYTFRVTAANKEGIWSDEESSVQLIVKEPFLESDLFFGLIFLVIVGVLMAYYFAKRSYETANIKLRNRIANDLHDEVSNTLNNIRIISTEAAYSSDKASSLNRINYMSDNAIEHVQDVVWVIDKDKENMKHLLFRIEDYIDILLRDNGVEVQFKKGSINLENNLGFLFRRNLLLIFKETLSNMVKHTHCKQVDIFIGNQKGKFILRCTNYYDLKKENVYSSGKGVYSMKQRAEAIGGKLNIEDEKGKFTVKLYLEKEL